MPGKTPEETDRSVARAIAQRDIEGLLDLFEPEALFIDPGSGAELRGLEQIREAVAGMFESNPTIEENRPPKVWVAGDLALVLSGWSMEATGPDGERLRQAGTATDVMRRQADGTWRYVIDNPAGIDQA